MKNQQLIENLNQIAQVDTTWMDDGIYYENNQEWLERSAKIALKLLRTLRENKINSIYPSSQKELAERMEVSPQHINKIAKGIENLTLETISRLEKALNIPLIELANDYIITNVHEQLELADTFSFSSKELVNEQMTILQQEMTEWSAQKAGEYSYAMAA
ncbi:helix-turn-helix domain-containing protein [Runella sp.]|uniref:helix-turn-helix domain-containing protein n=1 Tax=Runella sp. TaxID=1960881 RepID=UPI003D0BBD10